MQPKNAQNQQHAVGIIGTKWGLAHILGFTKNGYPIHGLCGRDEAKTRAIAHREGIRFATTDVDALCGECDVVVVASSDNIHYEHIKTALKHGCHVLTEKPITTKHEDAASLIGIARDAFTRSQLITAISYPYRSIPSIKQTHQWLLQHDPEHIVINVSNSFGDAEGRALEGNIHGLSGDFAGASHVLDTALWFLRKRPLFVQATLIGRPPFTAHILVELEGNRTIAIHHMTSRKPGIDGSWRIYGLDWELQFTGAYVPANNGWSISPVAHYDAHQTRTLAEGISKANSEFEPWASSFVFTAAAFLDSIESRSLQYPLACFADGALVQKIFAAAIESEVKKQRIDLSTL